MSAWPICERCKHDVRRCECPRDTMGARSGPVSAGGAVEAEHRQDQPGAVRVDSDQCEDCAADTHWLCTAGCSCCHEAPVSAVDPRNQPSENGSGTDITAAETGPKCDTCPVLDRLDRLAANAIERAIELEREVERLKRDAIIRDEQLAAADRVIARRSAGTTPDRYPSDPERERGQRNTISRFVWRRCGEPLDAGGKCRNSVPASGRKCWRHG